MDAAMEIEPRTSMERHLMDRDREGQMYLEARREQAVQDLLGHRTSFLSTITPPSTNPSSAASSLFHEPMSSSSQDADVQDSAPSPPDVPTAPVSPVTPNPTLPSAAAPALLTFAPPLQNIVPIIKKRRQGSASAQGRAPAAGDRPMLPISPSSLEYQLTASLLKYPTAPAPAALPDSSRHHPRSRSKPRQQKSRRGTVNSDARTESTGHRYTGSKASDDMEILGFEQRRKYSHATIGPMTPTSPSSSTPSSPTGVQGPFSQFKASTDKQGSPQLNLPSALPSPPLPPLPPKSPRSLIAHYFPASLAPPPSRDRGQAGPREPLAAPTPLKTPTFGPAFTQAKYSQDHAPPLPSSSASLHHITSGNVSRCSTVQSHGQEDLEHQPSSGQPSPCTSALGLSVSTHRAQQTRGLPSDLDFLPVNPSRGRFHNHQQSPLYRNQHVNNFAAHNNNNNNSSGSNSSSNADNVAPAEDSASATITTLPPLDTPQFSSSGSGIRHYANVATAQTTPIYPRGLMPSSASPLAEHPIIVQQKAVPYVRELIPGKENLDPISASSGTSSTNTSRDLEIILEEMTGHVRTNRTSFYPWPYDSSPSNGEPMPTVEQQKGSRYWVFRDQDGIVPGPYFFLLGHLCPVLWWVGSLYPNIDPPDNLTAAERAAQAENESDAPVDLRDHPMIQWLQRRLRTIGATITSVKTSAANSMQPSDAIATLHIGRISQEAERDGSVLGHNHNSDTNISTIHVPIPQPLQMVSINLLDTYGPWAAEDQISSVLERRLEHDQKVVQYDLAMRWRRINLIWSIGSFVIAVSITAFVIGFA